MIPLADRRVVIFIPGDAAHRSQASYVFLDVNPDATEVLQEPMKYMPHSGIAKGSKRGVFLPLLHVLLLFKHLKLQVRELLL